MEEAGKGPSQISTSELKSRLNKLIIELNQLLDALVDFSRVSRSELKPMEINLSRMVKSIIREALISQKERETKICVEEGLINTGDHALLSLAMKHLISNAFTYSSFEKPLQLEFGKIKTENGEDCYHISDNGQGISQREIERLFVPFHSFHTTDAFNGIGMGLPIVKRVIERHGGRIWIENREGTGTRVCFRLEEQQARHQ